MKKILAFIVLVVICLFLYGRYIEPKHLTIREYTIHSENIPASFEELKIVHFSDLLYDNDTNKLKTIKKEINDLKPDIIVFTGDLFHKGFKYTEKDLEKLKDFLSGLNASLYKYSVIGDNDEKFIDRYKDIMYTSDFILLDDDSTLLFYKDLVPINVIGIRDVSKVSSLMESDVEYSFTLLLTHMSDKASDIEDVDVIMAGHSLGGIINVPYYGGLIKKDGSKTYVDGYYELNNTKLYVSNGLGFEDFDFRLFNKPSINVYRFKKD